MESKCLTSKLLSQEITKNDADLLFQLLCYSDIPSQYSPFIDQNTLKCIPPEDKDRSDIRGTFHGMSICISQKRRYPLDRDLIKKTNIFNKSGERNENIVQNLLNITLLNVF